MIRPLDRVLRTLESMGCQCCARASTSAGQPGKRQACSACPSTEPHQRLGAYCLRTNLDAQQGRAFRSLFDRAGNIEELIKAVEGLRAGFGISEPSAIARVLNKQRRESKRSARSISLVHRQRSRLRKRCAIRKRGSKKDVS